MDNSKLNKTIYSYATSKNYEGAIMLTAEWGAGKSYYLRNELIPFLKDKGIKVLVVSLHGLKSDFEISKAVYVEYLISKDKTNVVKDKVTKSKKVKKAATYSAFTVKTIVKGVASFFHVDLSCSEKDLEKIYNTVDLSDTLMVFEDVERSKMAPDELLAYINNLVEYDHVKAILITNEKELKKKDPDTYKAIKEKTVGDTLLFYGDPVKAIDNMLKHFNGERSGKFFKKFNKNSELSKEVVNEMHSSDINLRSIMFGIEKFNELVSSVDKNIDQDFLKGIFISTLLFVHKYRKDNTIHWEDKGDTSEKLSSYRYPLHRFVYDFIVTNDFEVNSFLAKEKDYKEFQRISKSKSELNNRLSVLYNCYVETDQRVKEVVEFIRVSLKDKEVIQPELYFKLANYLIYVKHMIGFESVVDECLSLILSNLDGLSEDKFEDIAFYGGIVLDNKPAIDEYDDFKNKATAIVKKNRMNPLDFSYEAKDVNSFCEMANKSRDTYYTSRGFASLLDINRFVCLMKQCSSYQLNLIRSVFINVYSASNIKDFFLKDKSSLDELLERTKEIRDYEGFDRIQKNQIKMFIGNLEDIKSRLERGY